MHDAATSGHGRVPGSDTAMPMPESAATGNSRTSHVRNRVFGDAGRRRQASRKVAPVPVMGASLPISTGAASIAVAAGAPLIPVATVRDEGSQAFRVVLDDPIAWPRDVPKAEAMEAIFAAYGRHLETWIASHPGQWRGWKYLRRG